MRLRRSVVFVIFGLEKLIKCDYLPIEFFTHRADVLSSCHPHFLNSWRNNTVFEHLTPRDTLAVRCT